MLKKTKAFSFIEVMIAIGVFSIGILAILQIVIKNLSISDTVRLKTTATMIAKEGIDLVYNLRDSNLDKGLAWDCILDNDIYYRDQNNEDNNQFTENNACKYYFSSGLDTNGEAYQLSFKKDIYLYSSGINIYNFNSIFDANQLYYHTGEINDKIIGRYSNISGGKPSFFARYIIFKPIKEGNTYIPTDKLLKIESHVLIKKGGYTGDIVLESFIGNY